MLDLPELSGDRIVRRVVLWVLMFGFIAAGYIAYQHPQSIPTAHVVSSAGCEARRDRLHIAPAGYRELGKRYAEVMLSALGIKATQRK